LNNINDQKGTGCFSDKVACPLLSTGVKIIQEEGFVRKGGVNQRPTTPPPPPPKGQGGGKKTAHQMIIESCILLAKEHVCSKYLKRNSKGGQLAAF